MVTLYYPRLTCVRFAGVCASVPGCALCGPKSERLHYPRSSSCVTHTLSSPTHVYICHQKRAKNDRFCEMRFALSPRLTCSLSSLTSQGGRARGASPIIHPTCHISPKPSHLMNPLSLDRRGQRVQWILRASPRLNFTGNCPNWHRRLLVCSVSTIP